MLLLSYSVDQLHEIVQEQGRIYLIIYTIYTQYLQFLCKASMIIIGFGGTFFLCFFCQTHKRLRTRTRMGQKKTKTGVPRSPCLGKNSFLSLVYPAGIIQRACHIHKNMLMYPCVNVFLNLYIMHSESILHSR